MGAFSGTVTVVLLSVLCMQSAAAAEADYRFAWVRTFLGPCCTDMGLDLVIDDAGAVFVAGRRGGIDLDRDGTLDLPAYGTPDSLIFSSRDNGSTGWVHGPGGPGNDTAWAVVPDGQGGAYAAGSFEESLEIDGSTWRARGRSDGYLIRYDPEGRVIWAIPVGGDGNDQLRDVWTDAGGNVYVAGSTSGVVDLDGDGRTDARTGEAGALLASFDPDGALRWARATAGRTREMGLGVMVGPGGAVYLAGIHIAGAIDLDGDGAIDGAAAPDNGVGSFVARFDRDGTLQWANYLTGASILTAGPMAIAGNGDLLLVGAHSGPSDLTGDGIADVDFQPLGQRRLDHDPDVNAFLARYRPDGKLVWARRFAATANHVSASGNRIVMSGYYTGPFDLDDDGQLERDDDGDDWAEGYAAILDEEGELQHVLTVAGLDGDEIRAAAITPDGRQIYATGYVRLSADFDGDGTPEGASRCHALGDAFLARYDVAD